MISIPCVKKKSARASVHNVHRTHCVMHAKIVDGCLPKQRVTSLHCASIAPSLSFDLAWPRLRVNT